MRKLSPISATHLLLTVTVLVMALFPSVSDTTKSSSADTNLKPFSQSTTHEEITAVHPIDYNILDPAETHEIIAHTTIHEVLQYKILKEKITCILSDLHTSKLLQSWLTRIYYHYARPCTWSPSIPIAQRKLII